MYGLSQHPDTKDYIVIFCNNYFIAVFKLLCQVICRSIKIKHRKHRKQPKTTEQLENTAYLHY
jgi:hypothetical protein